MVSPLGGVFCLLPVAYCLLFSLCLCASVADLFLPMEERDDRHVSIHATHAVVGSELTFGSVTDKISAIVLKRKTPIGWFIAFAISFVLFQFLLLTITERLLAGIGQV